MKAKDKALDKALETLDRMKQIVKNDMLVAGEYLSVTVVDRELREAGSVCRGHKACAIGSLLLAYGVKPERRDDFGWWKLPTPATVDPSAFARTRPGLRIALDALNQEAEKKIASSDEIRWLIEEGVTFNEPIERLFENAYGSEFVDRTTMLQIINNAKRRIKRPQ